MRRQKQYNSNDARAIEIITFSQQNDMIKYNVKRANEKGKKKNV